MKTSKELLKELVDYLKLLKGFRTYGELSLDAGYKEQTLTQAISKKTGHQAVIDNLKIIYREILKNSIWNDNNSYEESEEDIKNILAEDPVPYLIKTQIENKYLKKRVDDLEKIVSLQEDLLKTQKNDKNPGGVKRAG